MVVAPLGDQGGRYLCVEPCGHAGKTQSYGRRVSGGSTRCSVSPWHGLCAGRGRSFPAASRRRTARGGNAGLAGASGEETSFVFELDVHHQTVTTAKLSLTADGSTGEVVLDVCGQP